MEYYINKVSYDILSTPSRGLNSLSLSLIPLFLLGFTAYILLYMHDPRHRDIFFWGNLLREEVVYGWCPTLRTLLPWAFLIRSSDGLVRSHWPLYNDELASLKLGIGECENPDL